MRKIWYILFFVLVIFVFGFFQIVAGADDLTVKMKFFAVLTPAALADSINPCAFAVLILLLSTIVSKSGSMKRTLFTGFMFIFAIFISYIAVGLGLYQALSTASSLFWLKFGVGILGILVGLFNIKDAYGLDFGFSLEVPDSWKPMLHKIVSSISSPIGGFFIGILVSLILLPCTSGPYITVLGYLASENLILNIWGYIYIIFYNIIFILPMVVITLLIGFGLKTTNEILSLKNKNLARIRLMIGLLMLLFGVYILYEVLI